MHTNLLSVQRPRPACKTVGLPRHSIKIRDRRSDQWQRVLNEGADRFLRMEFTTIAHAQTDDFEAEKPNSRITDGRSKRRPCFAVVACGTNLLSRSHSETLSPRSIRGGPFRGHYSSVNSSKRRREVNFVFQIVDFLGISLGVGPFVGCCFP